MSNTPEISQARRVLLERYLHGDLPETAIAVNTQESPLPLTQTSTRAPVVAIQTGGSKRPFFFLQGDWINGSYWCFSLAHKLGADQPFYTLEPYKFDELEVLPSFEVMAATHLKSLFAIQPHGPYLLGGFCNGALLAYEMARQLDAQGQKVDLLILIDPVGLVYPVLDRLAHSIVSLLGALMRRSQKEQLSYFIWMRHLYRYLQHEYRYLRFSRYRRLKTELKPEQVDMYGDILLTLKALHELWLDQQSECLGDHEQSEFMHKQSTVSFALPLLNVLFPEPIFPSDQAIHKDYPAIYDWIAMHYMPSSLYSGKVTFLWDTGDYVRSGGWRKVTEANGVEVHVINGKQSSWKTKNLHVLSEFIRECISKVQARTGL